MTKAPTTTAFPVTWFEVHTPDPERARAFYGGAFGWTFDNEGLEGYWLVAAGTDAPIGGGIASTGPDHQAMTVFNVQVPDIVETCARVEELGGTVVVPPQVLPTGLALAYVNDPDGSTFGVWTPPAA